MVFILVIIFNLWTFTDTSKLEWMKHSVPTPHNKLIEWNNETYLIFCSNSLLKVFTVQDEISFLYSKSFNLNITNIHTFSHYISIEYYNDVYGIVTFDIINGLVPINQLKTDSLSYFSNSFVFSLKNKSIEKLNLISKASSVVVENISCESENTVIYDSNWIFCYKNDYLYKIFKFDKTVLYSFNQSVKQCFNLLEQWVCVDENNNLYTVSDSKLSLFESFKYPIMKINHTTLVESNNESLIISVIFVGKNNKINVYKPTLPFYISASNFETVQIQVISDQFPNNSLFTWDHILIKFVEQQKIYIEKLQYTQISRFFSKKLDKHLTIVTNYDSTTTDLYIGQLFVKRFENGITNSKEMHAITVNSSEKHYKQILVLICKEYFVYGLNMMNGKLLFKKKMQSINNKAFILESLARRISLIVIVGKEPFNNNLLITVLDPYTGDIIPQDSVTIEVEKNILFDDVSVFLKKSPLNDVLHILKWTKNYPKLVGKVSLGYSESPNTLIVNINGGISCLSMFGSKMIQIWRIRVPENATMLKIITRDIEDKKIINTDEKYAYDKGTSLRLTETLLEKIVISYMKDANLYLLVINKKTGQIIDSIVKENVQANYNVVNTPQYIVVSYKTINQQISQLAVFSYYFKQVFNSTILNLEKFQKTFILPLDDVKHMVVTKTFHGLSTQSLLLSVVGERLIEFSFKELDPRREININTELVNEGFSSYYPQLIIKPEQIISHKLIFEDIETLKTFPSVSESTSITCGIDRDNSIYCTYLIGLNMSPFDMLTSKFNFKIVIFTMIILFISIIISYHLFHKKKVDNYWE